MNSILAGRLEFNKTLTEAMMETRILNYIHYNVLDEIRYTFPNYNGGTVEVWKWIGNIMS